MHRYCLEFLSTISRPSPLQLPRSSATAVYTPSTKEISAMKESLAVMASRVSAICMDVENARVSTKTLEEQIHSLEQNLSETQVSTDKAESLDDGSFDCDWGLVGVGMVGEVKGRESTGRGGEGTRGGRGGKRGGIRGRRGVGVSNRNGNGGDRGRSPYSGGDGGVGRGGIEGEGIVHHEQPLKNQSRRSTKITTGNRDEKMKVEGARIVWGTMRSTSSSLLKSALTKFSPSATLTVKRKTLQGFTGTEKRW